ncbi:ribonuclease 3-like protein 3 [Solanum dulcamara]|uniref:ribonuclease 3-like protein 3 n=1 Tax=Solanum dulcamara TaxID=45834 RepID=UPI002486421A|nr:ribonuclease 3-like protein 3 [Solanum dulcamara]
MGSWLRPLLAQTLNWVSAQNLQKYGAVLNRFLPGILANEEVTKRALQDEISKNVEEVQKIIGYDFNDPNLLRQAFTHPSYHKDCISYERLEYVGDSVLNLMITKQQFFKYPNLPPGLLSPLRAANVDTEKLARAAVKHSFHKYLRHEKPILTRRIQSFINVLPEYPLHSHGLINAPKVLADVVESTIGAVFIDSNSSIDTTWEVAKTLLEPIITPEMLQTNPVKKLYETCQKHKLKVRVVDMWSHDGSFEVFVDNEMRGKGMCHVKKEIALNRAANKAYNEVIGMLSVGNMNI